MTPLDWRVGRTAPAPGSALARTVSLGVVVGVSDGGWRLSAAGTLVVEAE